MNFSFTTLGTASALPIANRYPSAHVLNIRERLFLIDCGEGTQLQMRKYDIPLTKIDNIFISHLHGDHLFGLFGLLSTYGLMNRLAPLYIYGPKGLGQILEFFNIHFAEGVKYEIIFTPLSCQSPEMIHSTNNLEIYSFPLRHRGETYGFLFREKDPMLNVKRELIEEHSLTLREIGSLKQGEDYIREDGTILSAAEFAYKPWQPRSFAYCSDTAPFADLAKWVSGVDLLYHEATFADDLKELAKKTLHSTATDAAMCAKEAGAGKLVIGHYSSRYRNRSILCQQAREIFPNTHSAEEGKVFEVPLIKF